MPRPSSPSSPSSDVAFSDSVKQVQAERGSRQAYARVEAHGGFATEVDDDLRALLAAADSAFLATASADGQPYVQHRGGAPGFIAAIDDHTLAFVEHAGNRQYISHGNLRDNDRVCLLVMDYARRRRAKVWGRAKLVPCSAPPSGGAARPGEAGAFDGDRIVIAVTAWDLNCPKYIPPKVDVAAVAEALAARDRRIAELERELARYAKLGR